MGTLANLAGKLHRGKPVAPPAAPPPNNMQVTPFELPIPYALEEFPRTFLHLLVESKETPDALKRDIQVWLDDFEQKLLEYMHTRYGDGADQVMDMITKSVMQQQHEQAKAHADAATNDILADLERQMNFDEGGDSGEASDGPATYR